MTKKRKAVLTELQRIANKNRGLLRPSDIVQAARVKTSPLHSSFQWNDSRAAHEFRLEQARRMIRVMVHVIPNGSDEPQRVWVSINRDTENEGYRELTVVLSDGDMRKELLRQSLAEMEYFEEKYNALIELSGVFTAMRKVKRRVK